MAVLKQLGEYAERTAKLQRELARSNIDFAIVSDPDSIGYFAGFWNYLGMEFGRPTLFLVPRDGEPTLVTPLMESEMCREMSWVSKIVPWADGVDGVDCADGVDGVLPEVDPDRPATVLPLPKFIRRLHPAVAAAAPQPSTGRALPG